MARVSVLSLSARGGPMTASGIYQLIGRRGRKAGVEVNPHKFQLTFSHNWLDNGGPKAT
jgi:integrase/recombinase XerD